MSKKIVIYFDSSLGSFVKVEKEEEDIFKNWFEDKKEEDTEKVNPFWTVPKEWLE